VIALTVMAALVVVYVGFDWYRATRIWPAPAPPELKRLPAVMPVEEGAVQLLEVAMRGAKGIDRGELRAIIELPLRVKAAPRVPEPVNPSADHGLDRFLETSGMQRPIPDLTSGAPDFGAALRLAELRSARAVWRWLSNNPAGAWRDLADVVEFAQRIQHGAGSLLGAATGLAIERNAIGLAENLVTVGAAVWGPGMDKLALSVERAMRRPPALQAAMVAECISADKAYIAMGSRDTSAFERTGGDVGGSPWQYDPEKTRAFARAECYAWLREARRPPHRRAWPSSPSVFEGAPTVGRYLDNPVGRILLDIAGVPWRRFIEDSDRLRVARTRLRLLLAVAQWRAANEGSNPASLADLSPDYLKSVPANLVSGQPFDYDPESGLIAELAIPEDL
jgi:hypothetical protein